MPYSHSQSLPDKHKALSALNAYLTYLQARRPSARLTQDKQNKSSLKIKGIIYAARSIFIRRGHAGLTLRQVAEHAGIAVGNLTYHFPSKKLLLEAMLYETLADYADEHLVHLGEENREPLEILLDVVVFYAANARNSHRFFYQLWGYAGSDEEAKETMRSLYRSIGRFIYYLIRASNTALNDQEIRRITLQIFSLEEGYKLFIGMGPKDDVALNNVEQDIRILTKKIVMGD